MRLHEHTSRNESMRRICNLVACMAALLARGALSAATVEPADVFGPEMVLQRGVPVPVWESMLK